MWFDFFILGIADFFTMFHCEVCGEITRKGDRLRPFAIDGSAKDIGATMHPRHLYEPEWRDHPVVKRIKAYRVWVSSP